MDSQTLFLSSDILHVTCHAQRLPSAVSH